MVPDEPAEDASSGPATDPPDDPAADDLRSEDPVATTVASLAGSPGRTLALAVAVVLLVAYAVLIQQELFLVIWLLVVGFLVYLVWRFVRAHERLAGAAERLANDGD